MSEVAIRPFDAGDQGQVIRLLDEAMPAEAICESRFCRQVMLDPNFNTEGAPVAVRGREVVGFCLSIARRVPLENAPSDTDRGYITLFAVSPRTRRGGIGGQLLDAAEKYLRSQGRTVCMMSSYAPGYFIPGLDVAEHAEAMEFLKKRGYGEVYRPVAMRTDLADLAMPDWVTAKREALAREGVTIEPYNAAMTTPLLEFASSEFPGDWVRVVKEAMGAILLGASPRRLFVARDNGEVVGFAHFYRDRFGPIGVSTSQRGRGVGQLLMFATLKAQKDEGHPSAYFLWSDDKTAGRLYNAAGFKEFRRFALLKKSL